MRVGPIKNIALGIYDGPHATPREAEEGPIFLGIKNVTPQGTLDFSEIRHVSEQEFPKWSRRVKPQENDIVFSYEATLHRYALIPEGFRGCLGRRMALIRPDPSKVHPRFLHYYFLTPSWRSVVEANIISGATVDRIPLTRFPDFEVQLPEIKVQERIACILSAYDDLIENNRRRIQLLEQSAQLLYKEWFVHLRFPGHEHIRIIDGVPEGWVWCDLESLCADGDGIQTGPFGSQLHQSDYTSTGVPVVMPRDLIGFRISADSLARIPEDLADKLGRHRMSPGDIVYGRRGDIGRRAFIGTKQAGWLCGTGCLRIRPDPEAIHPRFLFDSLGSPQTEGIIVNRAKGATMPNLSATVMRSVPILLAPRTLQEQYVDRVEPIFRMSDILEEQNRQLRAARNLLLPRLMSGELAV